MPFRSQAQRGYLYANKPSVAKKFQKDTPTSAASGAGARKSGASGAGSKGKALPPKVAKPTKGKNSKMNRRGK